jgi:hypothetical protein
MFPLVLLETTISEQCVTTQNIRWLPFGGVARPTTHKADSQYETDRSTSSDASVRTFIPIFSKHHEVLFLA